ncbi:hypothetical protein [uncultured Microbacterium sp.]|uniref:hypothetical protein n=1 Tax=uncultured Microbacterium sp. TaxID=191216 RepID=UPI0028DBFCDE|nr:hypothetical protein [uncultured Microbacterium sp.]
MTDALEPDDIPESDLPAFERLAVRMPGHDRDRSLGHLGSAWVEHFMRHGRGDKQGEPVQLDDVVYDLIVDMYALDENGRRLYSECAVVLPKGSAKTEAASFVVAFDVAGPSRFYGWAEGGEVYRQGTFEYVYEPGEPMGRRIPGPEGRMMAVSEDQVASFYRATLRYNFDPDHGNELTRSGDIIGFDTFARLADGGRIVPMSSGADSKDGGLETIVVLDEPHLYISPEHRRMVTRVKNNLTKRKAAQPWALYISTMYQAGEGSTLELLHRKAQDIASGKIPNNGTFWDSRHGGVITDLSDSKRLRAVLEGVYGYRDWIDYDAKIAQAQDPTEDPADFRRFHLNQQASAATAFVSHTEVSALTAHTVEPLRKGDTITLGFDYAPGWKGGKARRVPDSTALIAVRLTDMSIHKVGLWEAEAINGEPKEKWNPPKEEIKARIDEAFTKYNVIGLFADPTGFTQELDTFTARYHSKLKAKVTGARAMYRYMSGHSAGSFGKQIEDFYEAILAGGLRMNADPDLMRHFTNARRVSTRYGTQLHKKNPDSPDKMDALIATILAWEAARAAQNKGIGAERRRRRGFGNLI